MLPVVYWWDLYNVYTRCLLRTVLLMLWTLCIWLVFFSILSVYTAVAIDNSFNKAAYLIFLICLILTSVIDKRNWFWRIMHRSENIVPIWLDLCLVAPSEALVTNHLSPSSSVFSRRLHLPSAVPISDSRSPLQVFLVALFCYGLVVSTAKLVWHCCRQSSQCRDVCHILNIIIFAALVAAVYMFSEK